MKSLAQYIAESEKSYKFKVQTVAPMTEEAMDKIEAYLARYNVESVSAPKTSIIQKSPAGFGNIGPSAVTTFEVEVRLPTTPPALQEELANAANIHYGTIRVYNEGEFEEIHPLDEDDAEEGKSVLADADYSESEKVDHSDNYGNDFVEKFVKNLPKSENMTEYKVE